MELAVWVREIEPWTWNWFVRHFYWGVASGIVVGFALGWANALQVGWRRIAELMLQMQGWLGIEQQRKPSQSASAASAGRISA